MDDSELLREARRRELELGVLEEAAARLTRPADEFEVHRELVSAAARILSPLGEGHVRSALYLLEGDTLRSVADFSCTGVPAGERTFALDEHPVLAAVVNERRSVTGRLQDMPAPGASRELVNATGMTAVALVPITVVGAVVGVLSAATADEHGFTEAEVHRLETVGNLGGLALANLERVHAREVMASQANALERTKSQFLNLVSHEMRGPLAVISGYLEMIAAGDVGVVDEQIQARVLPVVTAKVEELTTIVERMLTVARLEENSIELARTEVDVVGVVENLVAAGGDLLADRERLDVRLPSSRPRAFVDPGSVATIVANLVDNARKFSPPGSPIVVEVLDGEGAIAVRVIDQGSGIKTEHLGRLFTRFGRIVTRENGHIPGTGLGLWISRELARHQGGDITVETEPGKGSAFTMTLPRVHSEVELDGRRDGKVAPVAGAERSTASA